MSNSDHSPAVEQLENTNGSIRFSIMSGHSGRRRTTLEEPKMTLILELSAETETQLREAAAREGREIKTFIIEAAREKARQSAIAIDGETTRQAKADAALDELTRITEELSLYQHQR
jgi:uncharacterized protein (DUF1778 family)